MRTFLRLLLLVLALLAFAWVSWRVEFGGRTLWERASGLAGPGSSNVDPATDGPPMEQLSDDDRKALDDLVRRRGRP
ncbi:MAG: hypothetical protein FJ125_08420 [Deltaproteobacteria bacterium]|nr:hypothetical protein [Deltaproteobacteria bacterium]